MCEHQFKLSSYIKDKGTFFCSPYRDIWKNVLIYKSLLDSYIKGNVYPIYQYLNEDDIQYIINHFLQCNTLL